MEEFKKINDNSFLYFNNNKEQCKICNTIFLDKKEYREDICRDCFNKKCRENVNNYRKDISSYLVYLHRVIRTRAKRKNREFNLSVEFLMERYEKIDGKCEITKIPLITGTSNKEFNIVSIDRIDSKKGYTEDNVQMVCWGYNCMKSDMEEDVFFDLVLKTAEHIKNERNLQ